MLTKQQDEIATRLRDAGVPGDIAVLLASRKSSRFGFVKNNLQWAVLDLFWWHRQPEGSEFWDSFHRAFKSECEASGIK